ncbi:MAG: hypothetical protein GQ542_11685 [Desulforhopalus sp.]|nr:hypothetical protein [Desulforhopalus sp.]
MASKIEKGKVVLSQGNKETSLKVPQRVEVELKAEKICKNTTQKKNSLNRNHLSKDITIDLGSRTWYPSCSTDLHP